MRARRSTDQNAQCPRCFLRRELCLCPLIPHIETRTRLSVLRFYREERLSSNTVRIAALALPQLEVIPYGGRHPTPEPPPDLDSCWLLYPGAKGTPSGPLPKRLIVLDGSFSQTRRMHSRLSWLHELPVLSLPAGEATERVRRPALPEGMSTLEAIAGALERTGDPQAGPPLRELYREFASRFAHLRGRGNHGPRSLHPVKDEDAPEA